MVERMEENTERGLYGIPDGLVEDGGSNIPTMIRIRPRCTVLHDFGTVAIALRPVVSLL